MGEAVPPQIFYRDVREERFYLYLYTVVPVNLLKPTGYVTHQQV